MMIRSILIIVSLVSGSIFAQNSTSFVTRTNFHKWKSDHHDSLYPIYLELFKADDLYTANIEFYEANYLESHFIIADFDQDGLNDIIYEGYLNGGESEHVVFLHRTLDGFTKLLDVAGYPIQVSSQTDHFNMDFSIKHYGCCEDVISNVEEYALVNLNNKPSIVLTGKYAYVDLETAVFPTTLFGKPIQFETINPEYTLRFTPEIDDSTEFTRNHIGNTTAVYPKGSIGVALAEKTDDTGRVWWFVYMKNNLNPIQSYLHPGFNNEENFYSFGWISSRYVSILE